MGNRPRIRERKVKVKSAARTAKWAKKKEKLIILHIVTNYIMKPADFKTNDRTRYENRAKDALH